MGDRTARGGVGITTSEVQALHPNATIGADAAFAAVRHFFY